MSALILAVVAGAVTAWANGFLNAFLEGRGISGQAEGEEAAAPPFVVTHIANTTWDSGSFVLSPDATTHAAAFLAEHPKPGALDEEWFRRLGAVPVGSATWEIELEGKRTNKVEIVDVTPTLVNGGCQGPHRGSLIKQTPAGGEPKLPMRLDIDKPNPRLLTVDPDTNEVGGPYFDHHKITLANSENVQLVIEAHIGDAAFCEWTLRVAFTANGQRSATEIRAPGDRPFSLSARLDFSEYDTVFLSPIHCPDRDCSKIGVSGPTRRADGLAGWAL